jgi:aminoglycoside phosphotransferase (APT) family kinase protein
MGKSPLILAALASEAVPGLRFKHVQPLEKNSVGAADSALLTAESGEHFIIRLSKPGAAGADQDAELAALQTLSGLLLPFSISKLVGETRSPEGGRALLFSFIYGDHVDLERLNPNSALVASLGSSIAAIHNLPVSAVQDAGFPEYDPAALVQLRIAELDRALETGKIPANLLDRWERAFENLSLFRFQPTVIHGGIDFESVMAQADQVTGIMSWSGLKIADPAEDLAWIAGSANEAAAYNIMVAYLAARPSADNQIRVRAKLYSEFELARWLLHCISLRNEEMVNHAIDLLAGLSAEVEDGLHGNLADEPLAVDLPFQPVTPEDFDPEPEISFEAEVGNQHVSDDQEGIQQNYESVETAAFEVVTENSSDESIAVSEPTTRVYEATLEDDQEPYYYAETVEIVVSQEGEANESDNKLF